MVDKLRKNARASNYIFATSEYIKYSILMSYSKINSVGRKKKHQIESQPNGG